MLGVVVVYNEAQGQGQPVAPDRDFLGAPVLARAIAAVIPIETEVQVVVAVAPEFVDRVQADVVKRFGFIEVAKVLPWGGDLAALLTEALEAFREPPELLLLHDGRRPLLTQELLSQVLAAAKEHGAALTLGQAAQPQARRDAEGRLQLAESTFTVLMPQALGLAPLQKLLAADLALPSSLNLLPAMLKLELTPAEVMADADNIRIVDERDLSRAVEVWSRRAVDYAFLWPRPERFEALQRELEAAAAQAEQDAQEQPEEEFEDSETQPGADAELESDEAGVASSVDSMDEMLAGETAGQPTPLDAAFADLGNGEAAAASVDDEKQVDSQDPGLSEDDIKTSPGTETTPSGSEPGEDNAQDEQDEQDA